MSDVEILVAEDSATQALLLQRILERNGFRVTVARHGRLAWEALANRKPQLIISDIQMPEMDGYELCNRIKADDSLKDIPVILLTSLSAPEDVIRGLECGADNFIVKPYEEEFLLSRIQFVLTNLELRKKAGQKDATEIFFAGQTYHLTSDRIRSIDLLLSTYETAVQKNLELSRAKNLLERQAGELREKNSQMKADLDMARELQTAFLPHAYPVFPKGAPSSQSSLSFCHRYLATTELGGDFFDIFPLSDTEAGIFICDVMGHGVRAALVTAIIRGLVEEFRGLAGQPGRFLTEMNRRLCAILQQTQTPLFASAFCLVANVARAEMRYASAGHPSPIHLRQGGDALELLTVETERPAGALGVFDKSVYHASKRPMAEGDRIFLFTDGLYEVEGANGIFFEWEQLLAAVRGLKALPTGPLFDELMRQIRDFSAARAFEDDVCLIGMDVVRTGGGAHEPRGGDH